MSAFGGGASSFGGNASSGGFDGGLAFGGNSFGGGASGGGGYSSFGGDAGGGGAAGGAASGGKNRFGDGSLRPITIAQVHQAVVNPGSLDGNEELSLDGRALSRVSLIGAIIKKGDSQGSSLHISIDDGTGAIDTNTYIEDSSDVATQNELAKFVEDSYVKVIGNIRTYSNKRTIRVNKMILIEDFNEVTAHRLSTIAVHLENTRGGGAGAAGMNGSAASGTGGYGAASSSMGGGGSLPSGSAYAPNNNVYNASGLNGGAAQLGGGGGGTIQERMHSVIQASSDESGVHIQQLSHALQEPLETVRAVAGELMNNGSIYTTVDDEHFKSC